MLASLLLLTVGVVGCDDDDEVVLKVENILNFGLQLETGGIKLPQSIVFYYDENYPSGLRVRHQAYRIPIGTDQDVFYFDVEALQNGTTITINEYANKEEGDITMAWSMGYCVGPLELNKSYRIIIKKNGETLVDKMITLDKYLNDIIYL